MAKSLGVRVLNMDFGDVGVICFNRGLSEECQNCLWWEWDSQQGFCCNCKSLVCPIYREKIFYSGSAPSAIVKVSS